MHIMEKATPKIVHNRKKRTNNLLNQNLEYNGTFTQKTVIRQLTFTEQVCDRKVLESPRQLGSVKDKIQWIHVSGLSDTATIEAISQHFGLSLPLLQDILNTSHIAKVEESEGVLFAMFDAYNYGEDGTLNRQHQAFVLGTNWVLSFEEGDSKRFEPVEKALLNGLGQVRKHGADFLFNLLISLVVDSFYEVIEQQQSGLLDMEEALMDFGQSQEVSSSSIQQYRRDYTRLSKALTPFFEGFGASLMMDSALIMPSSLVYFRDTYDHLKQVKIMLEANREVMASLVDIYLSNNDVRLNRSMNQLTIVATIFIPLTFLVGVWGMNFRHMPELDWKYGYLIAWVVMIAIGVGVYAWFKKQMKF